jgi:WD40 repeat protein
LASVALDSTVKFWDVRVDRPVGNILLNNRHANTIRYTLDGKYVLVGDGSAIIQIYPANVGSFSSSSSSSSSSMESTPTGKMFQFHERVNDFRLLPGGVLVAGLNDANICKVSVEAMLKYDTIEAVFACAGVDGFTASIEYSQKGHLRCLAVTHPSDTKHQWIACGGTDTYVNIWDHTSWQNLACLSHLQTTTTALGFSHDSKFLAVASKEKFVCVRACAALPLGEPSHMNIQTTEPIYSLCWNPKGRVLAYAPYDLHPEFHEGIIKLWTDTLPE